MALGNPLVEILALFVRFPSFNGEHILLGCHIDLVGAETRQRQGDLVLIIAQSLNVIRRVMSLSLLLRSIDEVKQTIEADR